MKYYRNSVVSQAESWLGLKGSDKSNTVILNTYNNNKPLPRNYKVKHGDSWCATFGSSVFIALGYNDIFPIECSCGKLIEKAKTMGIWVENDAYIPSIGDCILYDWDDNGKGDDTGWPDHIGIVTYVNPSAGYIVVIEGNYGNAVKKRTININGKFIRGYVTPKFNAVGKPQEAKTTGKSINEIAHEVIALKWGSGAERKRRLTEAGYDYEEVRAEVNRILNTPSQKTASTANTTKEVVSSVKPTHIDSNIVGNYTTTANLYLRDGAGTNKKALVKIPANTIVNCYGYYSVYSGVKWYYIVAVVNGVKYTGFSCSTYLRR